MASCQQNAASGSVLANNMACGRCTENAILSNEELLHPVCSTDLRNQLDDLWVVVSARAITTEVMKTGVAIGLSYLPSPAITRNAPSAPSGMESRMEVMKEARILSVYSGTSDVEARRVYVPA